MGKTALERNPVSLPPNHYVGPNGTEAISILQEWFPTDPLLWQVGKYLLRAGRKQGNTVRSDLTKALDYLQRRLAMESDK